MPRPPALSASASDDLTALTVEELATLLAQRRVSSVELTDACLARIARHNDALHAFIDVYADAARDAAQAADLARRAGYALGPLHGIPFGLKDLVDIEGRVTTGGSKVWADRVSPSTGSLAHRLVAAGMIVAGKTHTVEFAFGAWGTNQHMGTPRNPWDMTIHRAPGGSSSGSGVAVAARLVPWAIGTDTGGSVRIPSAMCGLTGLKTTVGRIPTDGILPLSETLDSVGPLARSARDAAILFDALCGNEIRLADPALARGVRGLRLARMPDSERDGVEAAVLAAYDESLRQFAGLGAEIVSVALPYRFADFAAMTGNLIAMEGYAHVGPIVDDLALPMDDAVRARFAPARTMTSTDYLHLLRDRDRMRARMDDALAGIDALLTPTAPMVAAPVSDVDGPGLVPSHFTRMANVMVRCGLAVPNGVSPEGLPTSLQIVCDAGNEQMALRIGCAYQATTDWHR
ncbi:MAG: amidase, partial [Xanthobacteraceae bacterium]|nr:amidase [Xanthobacteraceae bacterium]